MLKKLRKQICKKLCPPKISRDIVIIFPVDTAKKKVLLIQEYIHSYDQKIWKFASGNTDKSGKSLIEHATEELAEELKMEAKVFTHFYTFEKIFVSRRTHCFIAENPTIMPNPPENPDTDFITDTRWVSQSELWAMIDTKEIFWKETVLVALNILRGLK